MSNVIHEIDKKILEVQKSTKPTFGLFFGIHEYLRLRSKIYYQWHLNPKASLLHTLFAFLNIFIITGLILADLSNPANIYNAKAIATMNENINLLAQGTLDGFVVGSETVDTEQKVFNYNRTISLSNTTGSNISNYHAKIILNNTNFDFSHVKNDGSDIRFYDSSNNTTLSYFTEQWTASSAIIWLKIPILPTTGKEINFYYGSETVGTYSSVSNLESTYVSNLLNYWNLNGNGTDKISSNNLTLNSGAAYSNNCRFGSQCVAFDGSDDYMVPSSTHTIYSGSFTVGAWIKTSDANRAIIWGQYGLSGGNEVNLEINTSGKLRIYGYVDTVGSITVNDNNWHYVTFVRDKTNAKLRTYVDGNLDIDYSSAGTDKSNGVPAYWGRDNRTGVTAFSGLIDEPMIFNKALTQSEIQSISNSPYIDGFVDNMHLLNFNTSLLSSISSEITVQNSVYINSTLTSRKINTLGYKDFKELSWTATVPENANLKLQFKSSKTESGLDTAQWYGPTSTSDFYTNSSGQTINTIHSEDQWFQYKVFAQPLSNAPINLRIVTIVYDSAAINVTGNRTWVSGTYSVGDVKISNGAVFTLEGDTTLNARSINITGNSKLVCKGSNITSDSGGRGCTIVVTEDVTIDAGSMIDADGQGYTNEASISHGPGKSANVYSGASYGGLGRAATTGVYGDPFEPIELGSSGITCALNKGGGAIKLIVSGKLTNQGEISADGSFYRCGATASGATGGSIWVIANVLSGSGSFTANGTWGGNGGYEGGGGRIAVYYTTSEANSAMYTNTRAAINGSAQEGTTIFVDNSQEKDSLYVYKLLRIDEGQTKSFQNVEIGGYTNVGTLELGGNSTLNVDGNINLNDSGSTLLCKSTNITQDSGAQGCTINVGGSVDLESGTKISADGQGYSGIANVSHGPGKPTSTSIGGSYGGLGYGAVNNTYGNAYQPFDAGSSGYGSCATAGGGIIKLSVTGDINNLGTISSNGYRNQCAGATSGASGGSIWITADSVTGNGVISANGTGAGNGGVAAGGGRVAIYYSDIGSYSGTYTATRGYDNSGDGSVVLITDNNLYVVSALDVTSNLTQWNSITVKNSAIMTVSGNTNITTSGDININENAQIVCKSTNTTSDSGAQGCSISANNLNVTAGSKLSADGQGYSGTSNVSHGPGKPASTNVGASHGGLGQGAIDNTYGNPINPTDAGSSGYGGCISSGGGIIKLNITNTINNSGTISANGYRYQCGSTTSGASGGSLWIITNTLLGGGTISADGTSGGNGGLAAGGGRVAIYYNNKDGYTGTHTASKGYDGAVDGSVTLINNYNLTVSSALTFDIDQIQWNSITVQDGATLTINGGLNIGVSGNISVTQNSTILCKSTNTSQDTGAQGCNLTIGGNLNIESGSRISADGQGYIGTSGVSHGPGKPSIASVGASHGGLGDNASNNTYGNANFPSTAGSSGYGSCNTAGGGIIRLTVSETINNYGTISANGYRYQCGGTTSGASGGSVFVTTGSIAGNGTISANGTNGGNGGVSAGGGRVALYYSNTGTCANATATKGGSGAVDGTVVCGITPIVKTVITTNSQTVSTDNYLTINLVTRDEFNNNRATTSNANLSLTSSSTGNYHFSINGTTWSNGATSVTLAQGQSSINIYYKDEKPGTPTITINNDYGWTNASQTHVITPGAAYGLKFTTGSTSMEAETTNIIGLTAVDYYGNTVTSYSGSKNVIFSGASTSQNGYHPTVQNSSNQPINFGSQTSLLFTNGVSENQEMVLYVAEDAEVEALIPAPRGQTNVTSTVNQSYDLNVTVTPLSATHVDYTNADGQIIDITDQVAGEPLQNTYISALDKYNNVVSHAIGSIEISSVNGGTSTLSTSTINPHNFSIKQIDEHPLEFTWATDAIDGMIYLDPNDDNKRVVFYGLKNETKLLADDTDLEDKISNPFKVKADPATILKVGAPVSVERNQTSTAITVEIKDRIGNPAIVEADEQIQLLSSSTGGSFSRSANFTKSSYAIIQAGTNQATFYYKDTKAGNAKITISHSGWTPLELNINITDTTKPQTPIISNIQNNQTITSTNKLLLSGTSEENISVIIYVKELDKTYTTTVDSLGDWSYEIPEELADGIYTVSYKTMDLSGNESDWSTISLTVDYVQEPVTQESNQDTSENQTTTQSTTATSVTTTTSSEIGNNIEAEVESEFDTSIIVNDIPVDKENITVLPDSKIDLTVTPTYDKEVKSVVAFIDGQRFEFEKTENGQYKGTVSTPQEEGQHQLKVVITYVDGQIETQNITITVDPYGYVYQLTTSGQLRLKDVEVVCYEFKNGEWIIWDAKAYQQTNPQITKEDGTYKFLVPSGTYKIKATKAGYYDYESKNIIVEHGKPVNLNIELRQKGFAATVNRTVGAIITSPIIANPVNTIVSASSTIATATKQLISDLSNAKNVYEAAIAVKSASAIIAMDKDVQKVNTTNNIVTATSVVATAALPAAANLPLLSPFGNLFSSILGALGVRKKIKKPWGRVYDAESNLPIAMAVVRIFEKDENKLLDTATTDEEGRFGFLIKPGNYYIQVSKNDYIFPSKIDMNASNYQGQTIHVKKDSIADMEIPMDPILAKVAKRANIINKLFNLSDKIRIPLLVIGTLLSIVFLIGLTTTTNIVIVCIYASIWGYEIYSKFTKSKSLGKVYDILKQIGLNLAIIRVFDKKTNKLVATKVSNIKGLFIFLLNPGKYYITITKPGYEKFTVDIPEVKKNKSVSGEFGLKNSPSTIQKDS